MYLQNVSPHSCVKIIRFFVCLQKCVGVKYSKSEMFHYGKLAAGKYKLFT